MMRAKNWWGNWWATTWRPSQEWGKERVLAVATVSIVFINWGVHCCTLVHDGLGDHRSVGVILMLF